MPTLIDCGSNLGQGYETLKQKLKIDESWKVVLIEPNPFCASELKKKYKTEVIVEAAVDTFHGETNFNLAYCQQHKNWVGGESNILNADYLGWERYFKNYTKDTNHFEMKAFTVETIVLEDLIKDFDLSDIYLKVDIEGKEFDVLSQFIESDELSRVRFVVVEWHERFFEYNSELIKKRTTIEDKFSRTKNLKYEVWH